MTKNTLDISQIPFLPLLGLLLALATIGLFDTVIALFIIWALAQV